LQTFATRLKIALVETSCSIFRVLNFADKGIAFGSPESSFICCGHAWYARFPATQQPNAYIAMSNTLFVGKVYHHFDEISSTNDWAAELLTKTGTAKTRPPEGTVVRADNQTAGKGQLGSLWQSEPGENLLLSVVFYPNWLEAQAQFYLSMAVAMALHDCLSGFSDQLKIAVKWPNDLYLSDQKTAGILIQNTLSGTQLQSSIVGIGLNLNQTKFPPDLPNATSLALSLGRKLDSSEVEAKLFAALEQRYLQLKAGQRAAVKAEYEQRLWKRGANAHFLRLADGSRFEGRILGVTEQGLLRIRTTEGEEHFELKTLGFLHT